MLFWYIVSEAAANCRLSWGDAVGARALFVRDTAEFERDLLRAIVEMMKGSVVW